MNDNKNILWAPWRGSYVTAPKKPAGCVFCNKLSEADDRKNLVLHRGTCAAVLMNLYPYNNGHVMLIPLRHIADIRQLSAGEEDEMRSLRKILISALEETLFPDAFNMGINQGKAAGAGIEGHLHEHIVPRWHGDTNFMPIIADTKVISEHMDQTYEKMRAAIVRRMSE